MMKLTMIMVAALGMTIQAQRDYKVIDRNKEDLSQSRQLFIIPLLIFILTDPEISGQSHDDNDNDNVNVNLFDVNIVEAGNKFLEQDPSAKDFMDDVVQGFDIVASEGLQALEEGAEKTIEGAKKVANAIENVAEKGVELIKDTLEKAAKFIDDLMALLGLDIGFDLACIHDLICKFDNVPKILEEFLRTLGNMRTYSDDPLEVFKHVEEPLKKFRRKAGKSFEEITTGLNKCKKNKRRQLEYHANGRGLMVEFEIALDFFWGGQAKLGVAYTPTGTEIWFLALCQGPINPDISGAVFLNLGYYNFLENTKDVEGKTMCVSAAFGFYAAISASYCYYHEGDKSDASVTLGSGGGFGLGVGISECTSFIIAGDTDDEKKDTEEETIVCEGKNRSGCDNMDSCYWNEDKCMYGIRNSCPDECLGTTQLDCIRGGCCTWRERSGGVGPCLRNGSPISDEDNTSPSPPMYITTRCKGTKSEPYCVGCVNKCKERCIYASSTKVCEEACNPVCDWEPNKRYAMCYNSCDLTFNHQNRFWNEDLLLSCRQSCNYWRYPGSFVTLPPTRHPTSTPTSNPTQSPITITSRCMFCPDCERTCKLRCERNGYPCEHSCNNMCVIPPRLRFLTCTRNCHNADRPRIKKCLYGCEFWMDSTLTPTPTPIRNRCMVCPACEQTCKHRCLRDGKPCGTSCNQMCDIPSRKRFSTCTENCYRTATSNLRSCLYGCDFWKVGALRGGNV